MSDVLKGLIRQFMPFAKEKMGFSRPPRLFLRDDPQNAANPLGKTGFYDVEKESITLYTTGRHPKDILRSLAHELQHHTQKCNGEFDNIQNMGEEGYAQNNPQLRTMEFKAYMASMCVRDFEDGLKLQKETIYYEHLQKGDNVSMSTKKWKNGELKNLLSEAWGFKMDLSKLNEGKKMPDGDGDRVPPWDDKDDNDPEVQEEADQNTGMSGVGGDDDDDTYMGHIKEDSGDEEGRHYDDDRMSDNDHIKAIEHHLDALRKDRDYDDDHESLEEVRRPDTDRLRKVVRKVLKELNKGK